MRKLTPALAGDLQVKKVTPQRSSVPRSSVLSLHKQYKMEQHEEPLRKAILDATQDDEWIRSSSPLNLSRPVSGDSIADILKNGSPPLLRCIATSSPLPTPSYLGLFQPACASPCSEVEPLTERDSFRRPKVERGRGPPLRSSSIASFIDALGQDLSDAACAGAERSGGPHTAHHMRCCSVPWQACASVAPWQDNDFAL